MHLYFVALVSWSMYSLLPLLLNTCKIMIHSQREHQVLCQTPAYNPVPSCYSTLSSGLNSLSAITLNDFIKPYWPKMKDTRATVIAKILGEMSVITAVIKNY